MKSDADLVEYDSIENIEIMNISQAYNVGYVIFKVMPKINCNYCKNFAIDINNEIMFFNYLIEYKGTDKYCLKPASQFLEICKIHILEFSQYFKKYRSNVKKNNIKLCIEETEKNEKFANYFKTDCSYHRKVLLDILILVLI